MNIGKTLVIIGLVTMIIGAVLWIGQSFTHWGNIPGDMTFKKKNLTIHFPLGTSLLISLILSGVFYLIGKLK